MSTNRILYHPSTAKPRKRFSVKFDRRTILIVSGIAGLVVFIGGAVYAFRLPNVQITDVKISGISALDERAVRDEVDGALAGNTFFIPRSSFFLVRSDAVSLALRSKFPRISSVDVKKIFPRTLEIRVDERALWGIFCNNRVDPGVPLSDPNEPEKETTCAFIDATGFAYEIAPSSSGSLLLKIKRDGNVFAVPSQAIDLEFAVRMGEFSRAFGSAGIAIMGYEFSEKNVREFTMRTREGFSLYVNSADNPGDTAHVLKTALDEEIKDRRGALDYVDLRFGNKLFYKFKK